jgi:hypothetical protein
MPIEAGRGIFLSISMFHKSELSGGISALVTQLTEIEWQVVGQTKRSAVPADSPSPGTALRLVRPTLESK